MWSRLPNKFLPLLCAKITAAFLFALNCMLSWSSDLIAIDIHATVNALNSASYFLLSVRMLDGSVKEWECSSNIWSVALRMEFSRLF